jgi:Tfp pilus assembly protein PilF
MSRFRKLGVLGASAVFLAAGVWWLRFQGPAAGPAKSKGQGPVTFNRHVAPIIFKHCADCHRPGQAAPFSLLEYEQVRKHAQQIVEVTRNRTMPPWLPEPGVVDFLNARVLSASELEQIQRWVVEGGVEGDPSDLPPLPKWTEGWRLGEPDLVVQMPAPYVLSAEGKDVYRNFVIPVPGAVRRYVKAFEFRPGNAKIVHHAFVRFDRTNTSRQLDEEDAEPGFSGIHTPASAQSPEGNFSGWQPGKVPSQAEDMSWPLVPGVDLVLQLHMQPSGKPESIQSSVGFYFTPTPPQKILSKIRLTSFDIDIPPGAKAHAVTDSYKLPVDVQLFGILPHAHYLGKRMEATATLPDGSKRTLLLIPEWNFNWQGDYRYTSPVFLPEGSTVSMQFSYDNSADNPRNPHNPPRRVRYGLQSTDEMAELWLQVGLRDESARLTFARDYQEKVAKDVIAYNNFLLGTNPNDAKAHLEIGKSMLILRRDADAQLHLQKSLELQSTDEPHYFLGLMFRRQGKLLEAREAFENALRRNAQSAKAHGNLGLVLMEMGQLDRAEVSFKTALQLDPNDSIAFESLREIAKAREGNTKRR